MAVPGVLPVTVIGGYLGAGKTTLVNHTLTTARERIAVLVNDFGDIGIDADLIESEDGRTISLPNGCICCSLVDGLAAALTTVKELDPAPDRLVIEASGVADPASVAAYAHGPGLALDAVIVVVDAETVRQRATDVYVGDTVMAQLVSAEIVVVNKLDLVAPDAVDGLRRWLAGVAGDAVIVETSQSQVDPALLFGRVAGGRTRPVRPPVGPAAALAHDRADERYEQWSWRGQQPVERAAVEQLMAEVPAEVVRVKGLLWLSDEPERAQVLQRVGARWSLRRLPIRPGGHAAVSPPSRLEMIGAVGAITDDWLASRLDSSQNRAH